MITRYTSVMLCRMRMLTTEVSVRSDIRTWREKRLLEDCTEGGDNRASCLYSYILKFKISTSAHILLISHLT